MLGGAFTTGGSNPSTARVVRLNDNGSLDTNFGDYGWVDTGVVSSYQAPVDVVAYGGKVTVAAPAADTFQPANGSRVVVSRFDATGSPDMTFGVGGKLTTALGSSWDADGGLALDTTPGHEGQVLVGGTPTGGGLGVVRLGAGNAVRVSLNAPTDLTATPASGTEVDLDWTDRSSLETGYQVQRATDAAFTQNLTTYSAPADTASYADTGLTPLTTYYYRVRAVTPSAGAGTSDWSDASAATANDAPVVVSATASPSTVTGTTAALSATATDDGGEANLTYSWEAVSVPDGGGVAFDDNDTNSAKSATATFSKAGQYTLELTASDADHAATAQVTVTVQQTLTRVEVAEAGAAVAFGGTHGFAAVAYDQFGDPMAAAPTFAWSKVSGPGTVSPTDGVYTAPATVAAAATEAAGNTAVVQASAGSLSATATVRTGQVTGRIYADPAGTAATAGTAGLAGLSGMQVYLDTNDDGQYQQGEPTDTTDDAGDYGLTDSSSGSGSSGGSSGSGSSGGHLLHLVHDAAWQITLPASGVYYVGNGEVCPGDDFCAQGATVQITAVTGLRKAAVGDYTQEPDPHKDGRLFIDTTDTWNGGASCPRSTTTSG